MIGFMFPSCQECGECYITIDGTEESMTRTSEACGNEYDQIQNEKEEVEKTWEVVYPKSEVKYICEDK